METGCFGISIEMLRRFRTEMGLITSRWLIVYRLEEGSSSLGKTPSGKRLIGMPRWPTSIRKSDGEIGLVQQPRVPLPCPG